MSRVRYTFFVVLALSVAGNAHSARAVEPLAGGEYPSAETVPCLSESQRKEIGEAIERNIAALTELGVLRERSERDAQVHPNFVWPVRGAAFSHDYGYHGISNFVDLDPRAPGYLLDYDCGNRSYDSANGYNHAGIDIFTWPFGWLRMDEDEVEIVAAAPGTIVFKSDGHYDRSCSTSGSSSWNAVYVRHDDGSVAWYGHMKSGSLTPKPVGQTVVAGEYLGIVGSSGSSTGPHLHLEVHDASGDLVEPFAGPCNTLNEESWWIEQPAYYDSAINKVATHDSVPEFPPCPLQEQPHYRDVFAPGETALVGAYYRDQLAGQLSQYSIVRPDGSVLRSWFHSSPVVYYTASYWIFSQVVEPPSGTWTFRVQYQSRTYEHTFEVLNSPPVARCQVVAVSAGPDCTADASVDSGSSDPDSDSLTLSQDPPGPYGLGKTDVVLTVSDGEGGVDQCTGEVQVRYLDIPVQPAQLEGACVDIDGDGFGRAGASDCPGSTEADCLDCEAATHPAAFELCDGLDNNCNSLIDEPVTGTTPDGARWIRPCQTFETRSPADPPASPREAPLTRPSAKKRPRASR